MDANQTPPEDSIFSIPIWNKSFSDPDASRVQMDPALAMQQGQTPSPIPAILRGVSVAVFALAMIGGGAWYMLRATAVPTLASIDLSRAAMGTVSTNSTNSNSFLLISSTSDDPLIKESGISSWTIQLPPGVFLDRPATSDIPTCYTIDSFNKNFENATSTDCMDFIKPQSRVVVQYLMIKPETSTLVAKKLIREIQ